MKINNMSFSKKFYAATKEYNTLEKHLNAPYMRRTFNVGDDLNEARLAAAFDKQGGADLKEKIKSIF